MKLLTSREFTLGEKISRIYTILEKFLRESPSRSRDAIRKFAIPPSRHTLCIAPPCRRHSRLTIWRITRKSMEQKKNPETSMIGLDSERMTAFSSTSGTRPVSSLPCDSSGLPPAGIKHHIAAASATTAKKFRISPASGSRRSAFVCSFVRSLVRSLARSPGGAPRRFISPLRLA